MFTTGIFFLAQTWKHGAVNSRKKSAKSQHMKRITIRKINKRNQPKANMCLLYKVITYNLIFIVYIIMN
jgi:hypothetical protein